MPRTQNPAVMKWSYLFAFSVAVLVVFGGYVRLTRSGLSIVEWNPVGGVFPPTSQSAWEAEFEKYRLTPEYRLINSGMSLEAYQTIFWLEWIHRILARLAGLIFAVPLLFFLVRRSIPLREFGLYFLMGMLFIAQAAMGWYMVASGLVDRPSVSHIRLTLHLLLALSLFGLALWTAFGHQFGFPARGDRFPWSLPSKLALWSFAVLLIQISYGGMTAGLKAGHVSDTWPRMFGRWIPPNLFDAWTDFIETPQTIVFIHRWLAWLGILLVPPVWFLARRLNYPREIRSGLAGLTALVAAQILLGILTILTRVQIAVALIHQANALALFALAVFFIHRFRALDRSST